MDIQVPTTYQVQSPIDLLKRNAKVQYLTNLEIDSWDVYQLFTNDEANATSLSINMGKQIKLFGGQPKVATSQSNRPTIWSWIEVKESNGSNVAKVQMTQNGKFCGNLKSCLLNILFGEHSMTSSLQE